MDSTQSNTQQGRIPVNSAEDLSAKNGFLTKLTDGGSIAETALPTAVDDLALYVVDDGGVEDQPTLLAPLTPNKQVRIKAKGTGSAGAVLALADPSTPADKGKVRALPSTPGQHFSPGTAEEDFIDGQLVLLRPMPRLVNVASADSLTALTFTALGATGPEVEALRDAILDALQEQKLMA
jgi:hypothetical protein